MSEQELMPEVGQWIVYAVGMSDHYVSQAQKVTAKEIRVSARWGSGDHTRRLSLHQVLLATDDEALARKTLERIVSAQAEVTRREQAARAWGHREIEAIIARAQVQS